LYLGPGKGDIEKGKKAHAGIDRVSAAESSAPFSGTVCSPVPSVGNVLDHENSIEQCRSFTNLFLGSGYERHIMLRGVVRFALQPRQAVH
jgi:hypothetical protein